MVEFACTTKLIRIGNVTVQPSTPVRTRNKNILILYELLLGLHCETPLRRCSSNPCRTGTCINLPNNQYQCKCSDGITGVHCDTPLLPCDSNPCLNNSTCLTLSLTNYTCVCPPGYMGLKCTERRTSCSKDSCQGSATCVVNQKTGEDICLCPAGRYGI